MIKNIVQVGLAAVALLVVASTLAVISVSYAQTQTQTFATGIPPEIANSYITQILTSIQPIVITLVVGVIGTIAAWVGLKINTFFNVQNIAQQKANEALIRDALHTAAWNAVKLAYQKLGMDTKALEGVKPPKEFMDIALDYVRGLSPEVATKVTTNELEDILTSKIPDLIEMFKPKIVAPVVVEPVVAEKGSTSAKK